MSYFDDVFFSWTAHSSLYRVTQCSITVHNSESIYIIQSFGLYKVPSSSNKKRGGARKSLHRHLFESFLSVLGTEIVSFSLHVVRHVYGIKLIG